MAKYVHRRLEKLLKKAFNQFSCVILCGARRCGKSTLVKYGFPGLKYASLDKLNIVNFAKNDPEGFLKEYKYPVIIDEIQECPELLNYIKAIVDEKRKKGMFIITGSQQFSLMEGVQESLAGRSCILDLSTFSFCELNISNEWSSYAYNGSYPEIMLNKSIDRDLWYSSYIRTFIDRDVTKHLKEKNIYQYERFISLLASRFTQLLNFSDISKELGVDLKTVQTWLSFLIRSQIVFLLPPYFNNLGKRITKTPKLYFFDTGLVASLTGYKSKEQLKNGPLAGVFFENLFISDLMKQNFSLAKRKNLFFFRENNGLEIDLIIDDPIKPAFIEIKSAQTPTLRHTENLVKLRKGLRAKPDLYLISPNENEITMNSVRFKNYLNFKI